MTIEVVVGQAQRNPAVICMQALGPSDQQMWRALAAFPVLFFGVVPCARQMG
jgi:hypothetical protein